MARFTDLPNEIIEMIVELAEPDDIDSQTSTCRKIYYGGNKIVKRHRELKRIHGVYHFSGSGELRPRTGLSEFPDGVFHFSDPENLGPRLGLSQFLVEIIREPRLAFYVKVLSIVGPMRQLRKESYHGSEDYSEDFMSCLREAALEFKQKKWTGFNWDKYTDICDETTLLVMLLLLLPNIETLKLDDFGIYANSRFHGILRYGATRQSGGAPFPRLRHVQASHIGLLGLLAAQPSVRSAHGLGIRARVSEGYERNLPPPCSNVRDMIFTDCLIKPKRLFNSLLSFRGLRSFTYISHYGPEEPKMDYDDWTMEPLKDFDFSWIRSVLLAHSKTTLESLTLLSYKKEHHYIEEIQSFESLRTLHTETQLLFSDSRRGAASLVTALPPKLETLKLECSGQTDEIGIARPIFCFLSWKSSTPALKKFELITPNGVQDLDSSNDLSATTYKFRGDSPFPTEYNYETIKESCKEKGLDFIVTAFDRKEIESSQP